MRIFYQFEKGEIKDLQFGIIRAASTCREQRLSDIDAAHREWVRNNSIGRFGYLVYIVAVTFRGRHVGNAGVYLRPDMKPIVQLMFETKSAHQATMITKLASAAFYRIVEMEVLEELQSDLDSVVGP